MKVVGFDLSEAKIELYKSGINPTREVGDEAIKATTIEFTADETTLREAKFHIVAVLTPVNDNHTPDLAPVEGASRIFGCNLTKGSIVVFESTVYPSVPEVSKPLLSGIKQNYKELRGVAVYKGTIIYVGNFELPDKGAAANRVAANGKLFRKLGYQVAYLGVKKDADFEGVQVLDAHETMYEEAYPRNNMEWLTHMYDTKNIESLVAKYDRVCMIILYNLPYILLKSVKRAFKGTGIKIVYDCTEWTGVTDGSFAKRVVKWLDEYLIRTRAAKAADGMIVISQRMKKAYAKNKHLILLPPLVDLHDAMWHQQKETDIFEFCFAGILDGNKESLDSIVEAFSKLKETACMLRIIGVTEQEFCDFYPQAKQYLEAVRDRICFMGCLSHKETIKYVRNCDCYIFIRQSDRRNNAGFPTKFAESYSCGVPIITTDISDISCYLKGNERGQMLDSVSAKEVEKAMSLAVQHHIDKKERTLDMTFHYESYLDKSASWLKGLIE